MNKNNVLQFSAPRISPFRRKRNNTNYFKALFLSSLGFNIILLFKVLLEI